SAVEQPSAHDRGRCQRWSNMMKARQLVADASLGPDALKAAYQAFDEAWEAIAANFGNDPQTIETARLKLANPILAATKQDSRDPIRIRDEALKMLALGYRMEGAPRDP